MELHTCTKEAFVVIGKEGSTKEGKDIVQRLWNNANLHFEEVADLAKKDEQGKLLGIWGAMSDFAHSFRPWENNFSEGYYLAGIEAEDQAEAPETWIKWVIPSYEYLYVKSEGPETFSEVISYMRENNLPLVGAVHEFYCPEEGDCYLFFPIKELG